MTEHEKMDAGLWYDANFDPALCAERRKADSLCHALNHCDPGDPDAYRQALRALLPNAAPDADILSPFYTDYGYNCHIGAGSFINHGAYLMDGARITIGAHCFIGPNCGLYTAAHPLLAAERNRGFEKALPITIGDDVWIGADVTVLPGVTIGQGAVIGAKSVVTKDIPPCVVAAGNPCRVLRPITEADSILNEAAGS